MGVPSVFMRTFGCNFQCAGFGMPPGEKSVDRLNVDPTKYEKYEDLPLVNTGCDSYASWDDRFKHLSPFYTVDEIANKIVDLLPQKRWNSEHLVITGGEPLLQWQKVYENLLSHHRMIGLRHLTFETNGTKLLNDSLKNFLKHENHLEITFSVSPKLLNSGHSKKDAIKPAVVSSYQDIGYVYLKFVVADEDDVEMAKQAVEDYRQAGFYGPVYLMPLGGVESVYNLNKTDVAEMALKLGWRYSDRLQIPLWKNAWGT